MFTVELKNLLGSPNHDSKQVTELAKKYKRAKTDEKKQYYKTKVVEHTLKLAYKFCQPTLKYGKDNFEDHFQLAIVGILEALERFDENKNFKFSTYATFWMRNYTSFHYHQMHLIKHPRDSYIGARKYEKVVNESISENCSIEEILRKHKISSNKFRSWEKDFNIRTEATRSVRIDKTIRRDDGSVHTSLDQILAISSTHDIVVETEQAIERIKSLVEEYLSPVEKFVINHRFLCEGRQKEYTWIAKKLGCGVDKVKSIEQKMLNKIKILIQKGKSHE